MNIIKQQEILKGLPYAQVLQMLQHPTGEPPQFLVAAELQRRGEAMKSTATPPETTVADDLEAQGLATLQQGQQPPMMPQEQPMMVPPQQPQQIDQGVAAIPTNMPAPTASMAGGGIVAFAEGGETTSGVERAFGFTPEDMRRSKKAQQIHNEIERLRGVRSSMTLGLGMVGPSIFTQETQAQRDAREHGKQLIDNRIEQLGGELRSLYTKQQPGTAPGTPPPTAPAGAPSSVVEDFMQSNLNPQNIPLAAPTQSPPTLTPPAPPAPKAQGIGTLTWKDIPFPEKEFGALERPVPTAEEEVARFKAAMGEDEGLAALRTKLEEKEKKLAEEEERLGPMSMIEFGLRTAAGTSPYALSNIGAGGVEALKGYRSETERIEKARDKLSDSQIELERAKRAEHVAAVKFGEESHQANKAQQDVLKREKLVEKHKLNVENIKGRIDTQSKNIENALKQQQQDTLKNYYEGILSRLPETVREAQYFAQNPKALETYIAMNPKTSSVDNIREKELYEAYGKYKEGVLPKAPKDMDLDTFIKWYTAGTNPAGNIPGIAAPRADLFSIVK